MGGLHTGEVGRSRLTLTDNLYAKGNAALIGHAEVKMVWIDVASQRPIPVPDNVRVAMGFAPLVV